MINTRIFIKNGSPSVISMSNLIIVIKVSILLKYIKKNIYTEKH